MLYLTDKESHQSRPVVGFPAWTELGQDAGLDPLAMQRATELVFQNLLVGISTITLRARYYSLFAWMLEAYAREIGVPIEKEFRVFHRRTALLYALVCQNTGHESGVSGSLWSYRALEEASQRDGVIDFAAGADPDAPTEERYLRNKAGTFRGIYSNQMADLGILLLGDDDNPVPVCTEQGARLVDAFEKENRVLLADFLSIIERGNVSLSELGALSPLQLSSIEPAGDENEQLVQLFFGETDNAEETDERRASTLRALLASVAQHGTVPPVNEIKWDWYQRGLSALEDDPNDRSILVLWAVYQANDLLRFAYETILSSAIASTEAAEGKTVPISDLVGALVSAAEFDASFRWSEFVTSIESGSTHGEVARKTYESMIADSSERRVHHAVKLIAVLSREARLLAEILWQEFRPDNYYQALLTEFEFLDERADMPAHAAFAELVRRRVLTRHLFVASTKFRSQRAYTYHLEPENAQLRYRMGFVPTPSSPRLDQALTFLHDLGLIRDGTLTTAGQARAAFA